MRLGRPWFWVAWLTGNALWLLGAPALFFVWIEAQVQAEYAAGIRTTTDGDSLGIPVAGFFIVNVAFTLVINFAWAVWVTIKRRRRLAIGEGR